VGQTDRRRASARPRGAMAGGRTGAGAGGARGGPVPSVGGGGGWVWGGWRIQPQRSRSVSETTNGDGRARRGELPPSGPGWAFAGRKDRWGPASGTGGPPRVARDAGAGPGPCLGERCCCKHRPDPSPTRAVHWGRTLGRPPFEDRRDLGVIIRGAQAGRRLYVTAPWATAVVGTRGADRRLSPTRGRLGQAGSLPHAPMPGEPSSGGFEAAVEAILVEGGVGSDHFDIRRGQ